MTHYDGFAKQICNTSFDYFRVGITLALCAVVTSLFLRADPAKTGWLSDIDCCCCCCWRCYFLPKLTFVV